MSDETPGSDEEPQRHMSEQEYCDTVVRPWLAMHYGRENVEQEVYLAASYRFADFVVDTPVATWAIEVENDTDAILHGVGQALLYAAHRPSWRPCVVTPPGHIEQPERDMLDEFVRIIEIPQDPDAIYREDVAADAPDDANIGD